MDDYTDEYADNTIEAKTVQKSQRRDEPEEFPVEKFKVISKCLLVLRLIGQWPPENFLRYPYAIYTLLMMTFIMMSFSVSENADLIQLVAAGANMARITNNLTHCVSHSLAVYKSFILFFKRGRVLRLTKIFENDERLKYESTEDFRPMDEIRIADRRNNRAAFSFWMMGFSMVTFGSLAPLFTPTDTYLATWDNTTLQWTRPLPFSTAFPFDTTIVRNYWYAYTFQLIGIFHIVIMIVCLDNVCVGLFAHTRAQFAILNKALLTIESRSVRKVARLFSDSEVTDLTTVENERAITEEMLSQLKKSVEHHQAITEICTEINDVYNSQFIGVFVASMIILCVTLFQCATRRVESLDFVYMSTYLIFISYQCSLYCWFGNEVTLESDKLLESTMDSNWQRCSESTGDPVRDALAKDYINCVMIIREKSKIPMIFKARGLADLDLLSYKNLLNGGYSYFALLRQINNK